MNINQKIKQIARQKNLSAKELGKRIGRSSQAVYDIYSGRVSVNVKLLEKIAKALNEPVFKFFIESPDDYHSMMPNAIPMEAIHKLMVDVHEYAKKGEGMFHMRIHKSTEGIYILDSSFAKMKKPLKQEKLVKLGNQVYESIRISSPKLTREEKKLEEPED